MEHFRLTTLTFSLVIFLGAGCSEAPAPEPEPAGPATVQIFMSASGGADCAAVEPLQREVATKTPEAVLTELLKGPTSRETLEGAYSAIDRGTKLLSVKEEGNVIVADFSNIPDADSCRAKSIHAQIEKSITTNFPDKTVRILSQGSEVK
ncbi:MAG: GerMN domain-containing protein [Leptospiraceae bacterium]